MVNQVDWSRATQVAPWYENLPQKLLEGYKMGQEPRRMRQEEEQRAFQNALLKAQGQHAEQVNKYYGPSQEAAIGLTGAQTEHAQAQTGKITQMLPYDIQEAIQKAEKMRMETQNYPNEMAQKQLSENLKNRAELSLINQRNAQAELNNQKANRIGNVSPKQEALDKEIAKKDAESYGDSVAKLDIASGMNGLLNGIDGLLKNPNIKDAIGPTDRIMTSLAGFPKTRELAAQLEIYRKQLTRDSLALYKGSTTEFELEYAESNFPSPKDLYSVYVGKMNALHAINDQILKREQLKAQYIQEGFPSWKASEKARNETPIIHTIGSEKYNQQKVAPGQYKGYVVKNG